MRNPTQSGSEGKNAFGNGFCVSEWVGAFPNGFWLPLGWLALKERAWLLFGKGPTAPLSCLPRPADEVSAEDICPAAAQASPRTYPLAKRSLGPTSYALPFEGLPPIMKCKYSFGNADLISECKTHFNLTSPAPTSPVRPLPFRAGMASISEWILHFEIDRFHTGCVLHFEIKSAILYGRVCHRVGGTLPPPGGALAF
jgi:hypothetical protein